MQAIVKASPEALSAYTPRDFEQGLKFAELVAKSRLFGVASPEAAFAIMACGDELGLSPMQSFRGIHIIEGRPCPSADMLVAVVLRSGQALYFEEVSNDATAVTWTTCRKGRQPKSYTYTLDDAKAAGLLDRKNWRAFPRRMMSARAKAFLARDVYPDILFGLISAEELDATPLESTPEPTPVIEPTDDFHARLAACKTRDEVMALAEQIRPAKGTPERAAIVERLGDL